MDLHVIAQLVLKRIMITMSMICRSAVNRVRERLGQKPPSSSPFHVATLCPWPPEHQVKVLKALQEQRGVAYNDICLSRAHRCARNVTMCRASSVEEPVQEDADIYGISRAEWVQLDKPARYLGNEFGSVHKPWNEASIRFALTYPEIYEVGASNLGHIILYGLLNQQDGLLCDRSYFPADDLKQLLQKYHKPLFGVESRRPLTDFDVLGFSLSYELGGTNILEMLHLSGIPVTWEERREPRGTPFDPENGSYPLVFAGGPTATSNPEPFAEFFDFVAIGDGEELLVEIGECLKTCKEDALDREDTLFRLATKVKGVYVPQFYDAPPGFGGSIYPIREGVPERILRRVCAPDPFQQIGLVPFVDTVHNRLTVEIRRGCTRGCRFCQPGMLTRPARDVDPERVVDAVEHGMRLTVRRLQCRV